MKKLFFIPLLTLFLLSGISLKAQTTLVQWNFDDQDSIVDVATADNLTKGLSYNTTGEPVYSDEGGGDFSFSTIRFNSGMDTKYWCIRFSSLGYETLKLSSQQSGTTGPKDFKVQYSTDSISWLDVSGGTIIVANDWTTGQVSDLALPSGCENQADVYIRWIMTSNTKIDGTGNVAWNSKAYIDNIHVTGISATVNDTDSEVTAGSATEPTSINSLIDSQGEAFEVFDVTFTDSQSGDGLSTILNSLNVTQGTQNQVVDWTDAISGAELAGLDGTFTGVVSSTGISFNPGGGISIAEGSPETYMLKIWLNQDLSQISDNDILDFELNFLNILTSSAGSSFGAGEVESSGIVLNIDATELRFSNVPQFVTLNSNFSVSVSATDENGNTDIDFVTNIDISLASGTGNLTSSSGLSSVPVNGISSWSDLRYNTEEVFTMNSNSTGLSSAVSSSISAQNILVCINNDFENELITGWEESTANRWIASGDEAINGSFSLHHNFDNTVGEHDMIAHPLCELDFTGDTVFWEFQIKHTNTPSSSNNWAVFLTADAGATEMLPGGNINGYAFGVNLAGSDDTLRLWKVTSGSASEVLNTGIDWEDAPGVISAAGFKIYRSPLGEWSVFTDIDGGFDNLQLSGDKTVSDEMFASSYFGLHYEYSSAADMKLWADDIYVYGKQGKNNDSQLQEGTAVEPSEISSIIDNELEAFESFDFTITDAGSGDSEPTILEKIVFTKGEDNSVLDWNSAIAGAVLEGSAITGSYSGVISNDSIKFTLPQDISIADGSSETISLKIWLKTDLIEIADNDSLDFKLKSNDITTSELGSSLGLSEISSGAVKIAVIGTHFELSDYPTTVPLNYEFSLTTVATDENGKVDTDYSGDIALNKASGEGAVSSETGLTRPAVAGIARWTNLKYNAVGFFTISANATNFTEKESAQIEAKDVLVCANDNFEDGDIFGWTETNQGNWTASNQNPLNGNFSLKHNFDNPESGRDAIARPLCDLDFTTDTVFWEFQIRHGVDPSSSNNWGVFLLANANELQMQPSANISGYVIGVDYSGSDDILHLWRVTNGSAESIINTGINWQEGIGTSSKVGIKVSRSFDGEWAVYIDADGGFDNLQQAGAKIISTELESPDYFGISYEYSSTSDQNLWADDIFISGKQGVNRNSLLTVGDNVEPSEIQSIIDNEAGAISVLDFSITDAGTGDGLPTIIQEIYFTQGEDNSIQDWASSIAGAKLSISGITEELVGVVDNDSLKFIFSQEHLIEDGNFSDFNLNVWLKTDLSLINDNDSLDFLLSKNGIVSPALSSQIQSNSISSSAEKVIIEGTQMVITYQPTSIPLNYDFSLQVDITDRNGNQDMNYPDEVNLTLETATGNLSSVTGLSKTIDNGTYLWSDLQFDTNEMFTINASTTNLTSVISDDISAENISVYIDDKLDGTDLVGWNNTQDWTNSDYEPITGTHSLKHNLDGVSGESYISRSLNGLSLEDGLTTWRFNMKNGNWSPSSSNKFWFYLTVDNTDLSSFFQNGYAVGVNQLDDSDLLVFSKITNGEIEPLITTGYSWQESTLTGLEITRTQDGEWTLKTDNNGNFDNLITEGTVFDNTHLGASYCGLYFGFSTTRAGELWFDDLYVTGAPDDNPPLITSANAVSPNRLELTFNEPITTVSGSDITNFSVNNDIGNSESSTFAGTDNIELNLTFTNSFVSGTENVLTATEVTDSNGNVNVSQDFNFTYNVIIPETVIAISETDLDIYFSKEISANEIGILENYLVSNEIGNPASANIDENNPKLIHLSFATPFVQSQLYSIDLQNIEDTYGNIIPETTLEFVYYVPGPFDVVINEIMFDISPLPEGLPASKYIEIINVSDNSLNLAGWTLTIGTNSPKELSEISILPGEYAVICEDIAVNQFSVYGKTIPILSPSQLTTSGKDIVITGSNGIIIDQVSYTPDWHLDENRNDGGWSLERIDPINFCGTVSNWSTTADVFGGTPGKQNTVFASNPDISSPEIASVKAVSSKTVVLTFSEALNIETVGILDNYLLNTNITPALAEPDFYNNTKVWLTFNENITFGTNTLLIKNLQDNCDNTFTESSFDFEYQRIHPVSVEVKSATQIKVHFSENIDVSSAQVKTNYVVNETSESPFTVIVNEDNPNVANLSFDNEFVVNQTYELNVQHVFDTNRNEIIETNLDFVYYIPKPFDIVFTEIMVDISPVPAGLPEGQYVEIKNISEFDIDLTDWTFVAEGQTERTFPYLKLPAGGYAIICDEDFESEFQVFGSGIVAGILGSSDLTNSGKNLKLLTQNNEIIAEVTYSSDWYGDSDKDDGGWSLEVIDPTNFCEASNNWKASDDAAGGTPGDENSLNDINVDISAPELLSLSVKSSNTLIAEFNEPLSEVTISNLGNFIVGNEIGSPIQATSDNFDKRFIYLSFENHFIDNEDNVLSVSQLEDNCGNLMESVDVDFTYHLLNAVSVWVMNPRSLKLVLSEPVNETIAEDVLNYFVNSDFGNPELVVRDATEFNIVFVQFSQDFELGKEYLLNISNLTDVNNNLMPQTEMAFTYYIPSKNDIAINEILFNPYSDGSDFVEIYNRSSQSFNLKDFQIAKRNEDGELGTAYDLFLDNYSFKPGEYLALANDKNYVLRDYMTEDENSVVELNTFPSFSDNEGIAVILYKNTTVIDEFSYSDDMHFPLLDNDEGVSLERINYDRETSDLGNWHSAAAEVGFATPGYKNSQYQEIGETQENSISIEPEIFSPDNDGLDDFASINYKFNEPGYTANVYIYSSKGYLVKHLSNNILLAPQGTIMWDGLDAENNKVRTGIYVVLIEIFDLEGNVQQFKKAVTVATKM